MRVEDIVDTQKWNWARNCRHNFLSARRIDRFGRADLSLEKRTIDRGAIIKFRGIDLSLCVSY